ncbi:MAG: tyrosine-type recombinase/integrase [Microbispora sp.]|nr:tyrosine-type recombinase/integrase [Microbispora sp.]
MRGGALRAGMMGVLHASKIRSRRTPLTCDCFMPPPGPTRASTTSAKAAGLLPDTTFHDLRHTFASTALAEGVPISEVSRWLGHESITTTVDLYGHLVPEASERARSALDSAFRSALDVPPLCPEHE